MILHLKYLKRSLPNGSSLPLVPPETIESLKRRLNAAAPSCPPQAPPPTTSLVPSPNSTEGQILALHNQARAQVGSPPLRWDRLLAAQAASYGPQLDQIGRPVHSSRVGRETSRENLVQAASGTPIDRMFGSWTAERRNFVPGIFPNVSRTGNWVDVGHYTQIIWPTTTNVGCAVHRGRRFDWLICRYSPPGNRDGKPAVLPPPPPRQSFSDPF